ncbi:MAG: aminotransferase class I/II-fold pyridoxal phosphate-dependent enzyme, partial [Thermodesulfobacteriota bacterium]
SVKELSRAITSKTRALIINSPSNPAGTVYTQEELKEITQIALERDIFLISDEIYEDFVYDNLSSVCLASLGEDVKKKTIIVNGVSKAYSMTGWRIGYAAGPEGIISAMTKLQSQMTSNPNSIAQKASTEALNGPQDTVAMMVKEFDKRRRYTVDLLNQIKGINSLIPRGAFYAFPNISGLLNTSYKGKAITSASDLATFLLEEARVAVVPGEAFGCDGHIRISYAVSMEDIDKGMERMEKAVNNHLL